MGLRNSESLCVSRSDAMSFAQHSFLFWQSSLTRVVKTPNIKQFQRIPKSMYSSFLSSIDDGALKLRILMSSAPDAMSCFLSFMFKKIEFVIDRMWSWSPGPNFIELLSTKICLARNFFLHKKQDYRLNLHLFHIDWYSAVVCFFLKITWKFGW